MTDKLIEHSIRPGEFRVKRATQPAEAIPPEKGSDGRTQFFTEAYVSKRRAGLSKKLAAILKAYTMIGIDTDGFEVWVI